MTWKLKKAARRGVVLLTVGMIAASIGGVAKASAADDSTVSVAPMGFWDGPKD